MNPSSIKGNNRPLMTGNDRKAVLLGLKSVDEVHIFDELTPERLIKEICPDVLVKGGDWALDEIVGAAHVQEGGGRVLSLPLHGTFSSTEYFQKVASEKTGSETPGTSQTRTDSLDEHRLVFDDLAAHYVSRFRNAVKFYVILCSWRERC